MKDSCLTGLLIPTRLALGTLTILEVVLGIDNIIFLSLVVAKLPQHQQNRARRLGLMGRC